MNLKIFYKEKFEEICIIFLYKIIIIYKKNINNLNINVNSMNINTNIIYN